MRTRYVLFVCAPSFCLVRPFKPLTIPLTDFGLGGGGHVRMSISSVVVTGRRSDSSVMSVMWGVGTTAEVYRRKG